MAKKLVTIVGDPSYTSGDHTWKGAAANLNNIAIIIKLLPNFTPTLSDNNIYSFILFHSVNPVNMYIKLDPNNNNPELTAPNIKYFNPASVEYCPLLLIDAKTYKDKLNVSIAKYIIIKSLDDINNNIPIIDININ